MVVAALGILRREIGRVVGLHLTGEASVLGNGSAAIVEKSTTSQRVAIGVGALKRIGSLEVSGLLAWDRAKLFNCRSSLMIRIDHFGQAGTCPSSRVGFARFLAEVPNATTIHRTRTVESASGLVRKYFRWKKHLPIVKYNFCMILGFKIVFHNIFFQPDLRTMG